MIVPVIPLFDHNIENKYTMLSVRSFNRKGPYGIQITHFKTVKNRAYYLIKFKTPSYEFCTWNTYTIIKNFYKTLLHYGEYIHTKISWDIWKTKQACCRNTSIHYLKMKTFLLERILQDALYESQNVCVFYTFFT